MSEVLHNKSERIGTCNKKKLPYVLSKEQLLKILNNIDDIKLAMIIFVGVFQGLRIGEIVRLKWNDIDLDFGEIKIVDAKNTRRFKSNYGKDRIVPINEMFIHIFKKWRSLNKDEYFIPTNVARGERTYKRMIKRNQDKLKYALDKVGLLEVDYLQKNKSPRYKYHMHTLRHVCGTNLYRAGMDIYQIKAYLGHEFIETTLIYCELAKEDLKIASHKAFLFPKSQLALPDSPTIEIGYDKETLQLQKDILSQKLELIKMRKIVTL